MAPKRTLDHTEALRTRGMRATRERVTVLTLLHASEYPVGIPELKGKKGIDTVTLYRTLESLEKAGLVKRSDLRHGHAEYELAYDREHHHHVVCTECGDIENVAFCPEAAVGKAVLKATRFARLTDHSLEFFGMCVSCA